MNPFNFCHRPAAASCMHYSGHRLVKIRNRGSVVSVFILEDCCDDDGDDGDSGEGDGENDDD